MNRLTLTCTCGRALAVPETALHQVGLCPYCGTEIPITEQNTRPAGPPQGQGRLLSMRQAARRAPAAPERDEQSWRKFAEAVDLYNARRYAEALSLLNTLAADYPGNVHVDEARAQCLRALQRSAGGGGQYAGQPLRQDVLSPELVKSVVLDKLLNSRDEQVQLRAAKLAARLLGMLEAPQPETAGPDADLDAVVLRMRPLPAQAPPAPAEPEHAAPASEGMADPWPDEPDPEWIDGDEDAACDFARAWDEEE